MDLKAEYHAADLAKDETTGRLTLHPGGKGYNQACAVASLGAADAEVVPGSGSTAQMNVPARPEAAASFAQLTSADWPSHLPPPACSPGLSTQGLEPWISQSMQAGRHRDRMRMRRKP